MVNVKNLVLFVTAVSARALSRRDVTQILSDLQAIDSATNALTTTVNGWDGSLLGSISILEGSNNLENQIDSANTDATGQPVESSTDSQTIISFINNTLEPDIKASLTALINKAPEFAANGQTGLTENTLTTLKQKTDAYSATLEGIASSDQQANAEAAAAKIDADFETALAVFAS